MKTIIKKGDPKFFDHVWEESWTYIRTVVDVLREPVLILNKDLCVVAVNDPFLKTFYVTRNETEGKLVYELGNKQWDIPELRSLLEDILPKHTFFKDFQVAHDFPMIGRKVIFLNARQIFFTVDTVNELASPIILLAFEDVTEMMNTARTIAGHTNKLESLHLERTEKLEKYIEELKREIQKIKDQQ